MKIGIDLGGSHIAVGLINENLEIIEKIDENLNANEKDNLNEILVPKLQEKIEQIISKVDNNPIEKIGIACPGTITNGTIYKAGNLKLKNFPLQDMLQEKFPNIEISIRNDAKCAGTAEMKIGSLKGFKDTIFLSLGTGIGGAVFLNGKLLEASKFPGFEMGHMVIEKNGKNCSCGKKGCFETYCSMRTLKETIREEYNLGKDIHSRELLKILGNRN